MRLSYNQDGKFRILQLTDTHIGGYPFNEADEKTIQLLHQAIEQLKPDLLIHTGDIIWSKEIKDSKNSFKEFIALFNRHQIPVAITFGNHDTEAKATRSDLRFIFDREVSCKAEKTNQLTVNDLEAYTLKLYSSDQSQVSNLFYVIDSGAYPGSPIGDYAWVQPEHVKWFGEVATHYAKRDQVKRNLVFQHIPVPEYWQAAKNILQGNADESPDLVCSPHLNTGLFAQMYLNQETWGMFVGHDHDNNFEGLHAGLHLVYGQVSGYYTYGDQARGVRVIDLDENSKTIETYSVKYNELKLKR